jgi:hypothetical protein
MSNSKVRTHQYRSREAWRDLISQWQISGESAPVFCSRRNIGYSTFCKWRNQLNNAGQNQRGDEPGFVDLSGLSMSGSSAWRIVLKLGEGIELQLSRG